VTDGDLDTVNQAERTRELKAHTKFDLGGLKPDFAGKVREVFDLGDSLVIVASDRISAYDHILPTGIPGKGMILTTISAFWFEKLRGVVDNHMISCMTEDLPESFKAHADVLKGRTMLVRKAKRFDAECVVRGYLAGSGWKDYLASGSVCGIPLPSGLKLSDKLPEPIFTPATKATEGHDENIGFEPFAAIVGEKYAEALRDLSLDLYTKAEEYARARGIILADTKFEFGLLDGQIILIDEALTPDSSRFWGQEDYEPGREQVSFDKQFVRNYLNDIGWDRTAPAPALPDEIAAKTKERYLEALKRLEVPFDID
jgi:phosphoribosylaminoimidazole-succinocarboxamide synthase